MKRKNRSWIWNILIFITLVCCALAFGLHYQNWVTLEKDSFKVVSGIYRQKIPVSEITGINFVPKIPEMERKNGFSWLAKEKGVFLDSITGANVYVFVDDLRQQKIEVLHHDSLVLYFNLADSVKTKALYDSLVSKIEKTE